MRLLELIVGPLVLLLIGIKIPYNTDKHKSSLN